MYIAGVDLKAQIRAMEKTRRRNTKWVPSTSSKSKPIPTENQRKPPINRSNVTQARTTTTTNTQSVDKIAETIVRYRVSPNAGAAIATAALQSYGLVTKNNTANVIDRSKVRRSVTKVGNNLCANQIDSTQFKGIYFDGRKDRTKLYIDKRIKTVTEEHISIVMEPGSQYIGHTTPDSGTAQSILKSFKMFFDDKKISSDYLLAVGCDGTNTNVGIKAGIIKLLELHLNRELHWFVCQLHGNELPLRHLINSFGCVTTGPSAFSGDFGKQLLNCQSNKVQKFKPIAIDFPNEIDDLSTDQRYLLDICHAIHNGCCSEELSKRDPGKMVHSRWLTTANRILRVYVSESNPSDIILTLTTYILKVYAPVWFAIKIHSSVVDGPRNLFKLISLSRYLPDNLKQIVDPVIQRNSFFAHPENILLCMLADPNEKIRKTAHQHILSARKNKGKNPKLRDFKMPNLKFDCKEYFNMIDWKNSKITEPPITKNLSLNDLKATIKNPKIIKDICRNFPCHTQAVERSVKVVTEASAAVCGSIKRDAWIKTTLKSRQSMPSFNTKNDYKI